MLKLLLLAIINISFFIIYTNFIKIQTLLYRNWNYGSFAQKIWLVYPREKISRLILIKLQYQYVKKWSVASRISTLTATLVSRWILLPPPYIGRGMSHPCAAPRTIRHLVTHGLSPPVPGARGCCASASYFRTRYIKVSRCATRVSRYVRYLLGIRTMENLRAYLRLPFLSIYSDP